VGFYRKKGYRKPKHNHQPVPIYQCKACDRYFSATQQKPIRQQHRPDLNQRIFEFAISGASMRRIALLLGCAKRTVQRKIVHLARQAQKAHVQHLAQIQTAYVMMDELETFVHARYRKVSVPVVVRVKTGEILAFAVCRIPANKPLGGAGIGPLPPGGQPWIINDRPKRVPAMLHAMKPCLKSPATIATDGEGSYSAWIKKALPGVVHQVFHSPRETSLGRAKKKATGEPREHDPLFAINVLHAKMRNDLARLGRKTWTTTKEISGLRNHLRLYVAWTNGYPLK
jgi:hypothetical protein